MKRKECCQHLASQSVSLSARQRGKLTCLFADSGEAPAHELDHWFDGHFEVDAALPGADENVGEVAGGLVYDDLEAFVEQGKGGDAANLELG